MKESKSEGAIYDKTETSPATKQLEITSSQGPAWEIGRCNGQSEKNMGVSDVEWMSLCKVWGSDIETRDIGTDKGLLVLAGKEENVSLGVVTHGG